MDGELEEDDLLADLHLGFQTSKNTKRDPSQFRSGSSGPPSKKLKAIDLDAETEFTIRERNVKKSNNNGGNLIDQFVDLTDDSVQDYDSILESSLNDMIQFQESQKVIVEQKKKSIRDSELSSQPKNITAKVSKKNKENIPQDREIEKENAKREKELNRQRKQKEKDEQKKEKQKEKESEKKRKEEERKRNKKKNT